MKKHKRHKCMNENDIYTHTSKKVFEIVSVFVMCIAIFPARVLTSQYVSTLHWEGEREGDNRCACVRLVSLIYVRALKNWKQRGVRSCSLPHVIEQRGEGEGVRLKMEKKRRIQEVCRRVKRAKKRNKLESEHTKKIRRLRTTHTDCKGITCCCHVVSGDNKR
jgi:hypothetical protein